MIRKLALWVCFSVLLAACGGSAEPVDEIGVATVTQAIPATATATLPPTSTPQPTPLPGVVTVPLETMADGYPWLPTDETQCPGTFHMGFYTLAAPFDNVFIRKAFVYALDRSVIAETAAELMANYSDYQDITVASSLTPPSVLGRDTAGELGLGFDPLAAKEFLSLGGYEDPANFPPTVFRVLYGDTSFDYEVPGFDSMIAEMMIAMWRDNLGIDNIQLEITQGGHAEYLNTFDANPPGMFFLNYCADEIDPDYFLGQPLFIPHQGPGFEDPVYTQLVAEAKELSDPYQRQLLYLQAESYLNEEAVPVIPLFYVTYTD